MREDLILKSHGRRLGVNATSTCSIRMATSCRLLSHCNELAKRCIQRRSCIAASLGIVPGSRAIRTLLSSVWAAAAVPASVLTAARKLKYSWILRRLSGLITQGESVSLLGEQYLSPFRCRSHHQLTPPFGSPFTIPVAANPAGPPPTRLAPGTPKDHPCSTPSPPAYPLSPLPASISPAGSRSAPEPSCSLP